MPVAAVERRRTHIVTDRLPDGKLPLVMEFVAGCPDWELNGERMSAGELSAKLKRGYDDIEAGRDVNAAAAFEQRRKNRQ